jgi:hypothetical protein
MIKKYKENSFTESIITLGVLCIGGYFLYRYLISKKPIIQIISKQPIKGVITVSFKQLQKEYWLLRNSGKTDNEAVKILVNKYDGTEQDIREELLLI